MCGLENFHPAGRNGWLMMSDCIMDRPPMMLIVSFSYPPLFNLTLNHSLLCQEPWFVIMDPTRNLMLICKAL
jgi:hypothetical protein